jgi:hypothetical protein
MNVEDRTRFARYYPGYIEPPEADTSDNEKNQENQGNEETIDKKTTDKKNILGYIDKISIDKDKLVMDTIINK